MRIRKRLVLFKSNLIQYIYIVVWGEYYIMHFVGESEPRILLKLYFFLCFLFHITINFVDCINLESETEGFNIMVPELFLSIILKIWEKYWHYRHLLIKLILLLFFKAKNCLHFYLSLRCKTFCRIISNSSQISSTPKPTVTFRNCSFLCVSLLKELELICHNQLSPPAETEINPSLRDVWYGYCQYY